jgi:hypothetical protein
MAYKTFSIDGLLSTGGNDVLRAAGNPGTPNNERIVVKRLKFTNILADGGAVATLDVWKGATRVDATRYVRSAKLNPGESIEMDPTFQVLEPGETLWFAATPAGSVSAQGDGAVTTE